VQEVCFPPSVDSAIAVVFFSALGRCSLVPGGLSFLGTTVLEHLEANQHKTAFASSLTTLGVLLGGGFDIAVDITVAAGALAAASPLLYYYPLPTPSPTDVLYPKGPPLPSAPPLRIPSTPSAMLNNPGAPTTMPPPPEFRHMSTGSLNIPPGGPNGAVNGQVHAAAGPRARFDGPRSPPGKQSQSQACARSNWPLMLTASTDTAHVPCKFFRQGACQAGNSCPFSHDLASTNDNVCKYFAKVRLPRPSHKLPADVGRETANSVLSVPTPMCSPTGAA
jgi:hypothetical protein